MQTLLRYDVRGAILVDRAASDLRFCRIRPFLLSSHRIERVKREVSRPDENSSLPNHGCQVDAFLPLSRSIDTLGDHFLKGGALPGRGDDLGAGRQALSGLKAPLGCSIYRVKSIDRTIRRTHVQNAIRNDRIGIAAVKLDLPTCALGRKGAREEQKTEQQLGVGLA